MKYIGITTTVPSEVLIAAGYTPLDLNNIFITADDISKYIKIAEEDGFPASYCSWIKGIYGVCISNDIKEIVAVVSGDCSNSIVLAELLADRGIIVHPFEFPISRDYLSIKSSIDKFMCHFNVTLNEVEDVRKSLSPLRNKIIELDKLSYTDCKVKGFENHLYQVCMSDYNLDYKKFESEIEEKLLEINKRDSLSFSLRIAYVGVPPITTDLYDFIETQNACVVYNEVQREFSMPRHSACKDIYEQYLLFTYPYDTASRIKEIEKQIEERKIDAVIYYNQAFCYRSVQYILLKKAIDIPILHIEGDKSVNIDARTKLRLEAFIDMVKDRKLFKNCSE